MKYSNGFYLFQIDKKAPMEIEPVNFTYCWKYIKTINNFYSYSFSYYFTNELYVDFDETNIWFDEDRKLFVIFTLDEKLLDYVFKGISSKFNVTCIPYEIGNQAFFLKNGKSTITTTYRNKYLNKVKTSLLKSDFERIQVIEKLLIGGLNGRNVEQCNC